MRDLIATYKEVVRKRRARIAAEREAAEKRAIAKAFNDRYTYRKQLIKELPYLPGSYYGVPHRGGYAWMCPDCNRMHHPVADSVFSGLQYPACCSRGEGHRLGDGIRTQ
jgi:hypothetical protein